MKIRKGKIMETIGYIFGIILQVLEKSLTADQALALIKDVFKE